MEKMKSKAAIDLCIQLAFQYSDIAARKERDAEKLVKEAAEDRAKAIEQWNDATILCNELFGVSAYRYKWGKQLDE